MFARIVIIATHKPDETTPLARLARTWAANGHAVRIWCPPANGACAAFEAVRTAFRPTMALWCDDALKAANGSDLAQCVADACVSGVLSDTPDADVPACLDLILANTTDAIPAHSANGGRVIIAMPPAVDADYRNAVLSDPEATRSFLAFDQFMTAERKEMVDAALTAAPALQPLMTHPSWPDALDRVADGANPAYLRRTAAFFIAANGTDIPARADIALRVAEGALVLCEQGAAAANGAFIEPVVFNDAADLARIVADLLDNPENAARLRSRQQEALTRLPLLDVAAKDALAAIDEATESAADSRPRVLGQTERALKIVMFGWFGARNFGDDLLLTSTVARIEARYPQAYFCVIGANAQVLEHEYGFEAATPDQKYVARAFLESARAMVLCGGLLFDDPLARTAGEMEFCLDPWIEPTGQAALCLMARALGVPSVYLGFGAGPIENRSTRIAVHLIARSDALFLPRDQHTCDLMEACNVPSQQVRLRADLVLGARNYVESRALAPDGLPEAFFTVSLRRWHLNPPDFAQQIARAIDDATQRTGLTAVFLPFDQDDAALHAEVVGFLQHPEAAHAIEQRPDEAALLGIVAQSRFAFAMRLHCSILHHILNKPAVGLNYNDKIQAHFERLGQRDMLLELSADAQHMAEALAQASAWDDAHRHVLDCKLGQAADAVAAAFDDLFEAIETPLETPAGKAAYFPRRVSNVEHLLRQELRGIRRDVDNAHADAARLQEENAALREELDAVRASTTWKAGRVVTALPRAIKRALKR